VSPGGDGRKPRAPGVVFTDRGVRALKPRAAGLFDVWDAGLPGFGVRVMPSGVKSWTIRYRFGGRKRRLRIGHPWTGFVPVTPLKEARQLAREALAMVSRGEDPAVARARAQSAAGTVEALAEAFLASREARKWRPKTRTEFERLIRAELLPVLGHLAPPAVTRGEVRALVERIADGVPGRSPGEWNRRPAPYVANRVLQVLKLLWSWALAADRVESSPLVGLKRPHDEKPRDIEYSDDEIRRVFVAAAAAGEELTDLVELLFYTAGRLTEVAGMTWSELDLERGEWRLPPERSKIGRKKPRARVVPLSAPAIAVLRRRRSAPVVTLARGRFVFPAARGAGHLTRPTKLLSALKRAADVPSFMPHGVRHTIRARLARLGVAPHVAELVLGHALRGMEGQYVGTGVEFVGEMRDALDRWAAELARILAPVREAAPAGRV
jgi:integrase